MKKGLKWSKSSPKSSGKGNVVACVLFPERYKVELGPGPTVETS